MKRDDVFPSKWLKASDLNGPCRAIIGRVEKEKIGEDLKAVAYFSRAQLDVVKEKGLVLNNVNWTSIETLHGEDSDDWHGCEITIYPTTTMWAGKKTPCIRIDDRPPQMAAAKPDYKSGLPSASNGTPKPKLKPMVDERNPPDDMNDEVPF